MGKRHLSLPPNGATIDEISNIEDIQTTADTHTNEDTEAACNDNCYGSATTGKAVCMCEMQKNDAIHCNKNCRTQQLPNNAKTINPKISAELRRMKVINNA